MHDHPTARCGRDDSHGGHVYFRPNARTFGHYMSDARSFCAGNRNVVTAVLDPDRERITIDTQSRTFADLARSAEENAR